MWEEFQQITRVKKFNNTLLFLDSLTNEEEAADLFSNEGLVIAFYGTEKKPHTVYAFNLADINAGDNIRSFFEKKFQAKKTERAYHCVLSNQNGNTDFYFHVDAGLVLITTSDSLMTAILSKEDKNTLAENKSFVGATGTSSKNKGLDIYLHFPYFYQQAWNRYLNADRAGDYFKAETERWLPLDVAIDPSEISIKGFLPKDSTVLRKTISHQEADDLKKLFNYLPYHTSYFEAVNISNYGSFVKDNYGDDIDKRHTDLKKYSDSLSADAQTEINKFIGGYLATFETTMNDTSFLFGLVGLEDNDKAITFLKNVSDSVIINNDSANLFYIRDGDLFTKLVAGFFKAPFRYVSIYNEAALFSNSSKALRELTRAGGKNNFSSNERAISFIHDNFNAELNYFAYADILHAKEKIKNCFSVQVDKQLEEAPELYEKFDAVAFSLQNVKENVLLSGRAGFNPKYKMYQNTLWETIADTDLYKLPTPVINHKTNENELVCQDMNGQLYLLSNTGKILWKKNVKEKILGDIQQVDYFNNGKLQLLFATENYIHVIDRNGGYLSEFPVKIRSGAASGISIFDYEGTKNYRLWLPLKNNTVCCLTSACKLVEGFIPVNTKAPLARPIKQVVIKQKDHFILTDTLGNIYVANRKGEERLKITNKLPVGNGPVHYDIGKDISKTYLCYVDIAKNVFCRISLADKIEKVELKPENETKGYFFDTLSQKGSPLVVLISEDHFESFDLFGKKVSDVKLSQEVQPRATALNFAGKVIYAALETSSGVLVMSNNAARSKENSIKLTDLPGTYNLISGQPDYLVGYYQNKIFCIKP